MVRMQMANHILAKEGILTTFSIAKKVTAKDVKKLREKMKSAKLDAEKFNELLKLAVIKEAKHTIESEHIPGLLIIGAEDNEEKRRIMEFTYFASVIARKLAEKGVSKYYSCYIVNALVNMLQLTEEDFDEFHKKFSKFRNGENDENGE